MTTTTGSFPKALWPGVRRWSEMAYNDHPLEAGMVFEMLSSNKKYEEIVAGSGLPLAPIKAEGASTTYYAHVQGPVSRFTNVSYSLGAIVTYEAQQDNQYAEIARARARSIGRSHRQTKEIVCANILNRAFDSGFLGGDGVSLCSTAHPVAAGGTQSNRLAIASDLNEGAVEDLLVQIGEARDTNSLLIALREKKLVVPVALKFEAERIVNSALRSGTANNDVNAMRSMGMIPQGVMQYHYLDDPDAWFITTDAPDGLICFEREGFSLKRDGDFDTDNFKFKGFERFVPGWADFRGIYGSPGA